MAFSDSENLSDSEFDQSDLQSSRGLSEAKPTPGRGDPQLKNLPYDEALELSQSHDDSRASPVKGSRAVSNQKYDEALDVSASMDAKGTPMRGGGEAKGGGRSSMVKDKPFDEAFDVSDEGSEESGSVESSSTGGSRDRPGQMQHAPSQAAAAKRDLSSSGALSALPQSESKAGASAPQRGAMGSAGAEESSSESESDDDDSHPGLQIDGAYNPNDYKNLSVSAEIKDLFNYIQRYKPHEVELDSNLKCFIPDYIPAVGEMDAFIKVPPPDTTRDDLGLKVLDEPAAQQSDPTVLELQLRAILKKQHGEVSVRSIENAAKNPQEVMKWIKSIEELHTQKHSVEVQYKRNMPDIESLMAEWPAEFEEQLKQLKLPDPEMDLSVEEYARVICALMDIPVYDNVIESLHVLFSLYTAFKENPHFAARSKETAGDAGDGQAQQGAFEDGGAQVFRLD